MIRHIAAAVVILSTTAAMAQVAPQPPSVAPSKASKPAKAAAPRKPVAPPVEAPLPPAEGEQNAAASMVHFGDYDCEFKQTVKVAMNPKYDGYIDVTFGKQRYTMKPVLSTTGALRLEDVKGETLMLQIAYKSMLMDVKAGHRLVDECVHEKQAMAKKAAEGVPQQALLTGGPAATSVNAATAAISR